MSSKAGRRWLIAGAAVALLLVTVLVAVSFLDEPLRRYVERQANDRLPDYRITIGALDLHPLTLAVDLHDVVVRHQAHPDPALAVVPRVTADAGFFPLLAGTLSADLHVETPLLSATRQQIDTILHKGAQESKEEAETWQDRVRDLVAFRVGMHVTGGEVVYDGAPVVEPVRIRDLEVHVGNLTNRSARDASFPSDLHLQLTLLNHAQVSLDGHADPLAKPQPALDAEFMLKNLDAARALSVIGQSDAPVRQGVVEVAGRIEYAPERKAVTIHDVTVKGPKIEYVKKPESDKTATEVKEAAGTARAWQDTVTGLFLITIERASVKDGEIAYRPDKKADPILIHNLNVAASNIRNRESQPGDYPSEVRVGMDLAEESKMTLDGRVDVFAKPLPGVDAQVELKHLRLGNFLPVAERFNVQLRQGMLDMSGRVQYSAKRTRFVVDRFLLDSAKVDYVYASSTKGRDAEGAKKGMQKAKEAQKDPSVVVIVGQGKILNSEVGFVNKTTTPDYRVFMTDMNVDMNNFSNRPQQGVGQVKLTGRFMGSGPTTVSGAFRPEKPTPDFNLQVRIIKTKVKSMNDLLRAYGAIDTTGGHFAFFSELSVKDNHIGGYVKPLLKDIEVYDPKQDKDKAVTQRLYEAVVGGVLGALENTPRSEVATQTDVSGEVENPQADTWQVVGNLIQNAFFKAILPGFSKTQVG